MLKKKNGRLASYEQIRGNKSLLTLMSNKLENILNMAKAVAFGNFNYVYFL